MTLAILMRKTEGCLLFKRFSTLSSWCEAQWYAGKCGAGYILTRRHQEDE